MALTALLFAHHGAGLEGEPPAVERVAGVSVIERQVAQMRALGAVRILVAVERMPPKLAVTLDQIGIDVVRAGQGFAVAADEQILVIEDSLIVDRRIIAAVLEKPAPALAVWKGRAGHEGAQRIDPATHWAGVSLYPGALVAQALDGLGEWDLQATLLRTAFAEGRPARVDAAALSAYEPELRREVPLLWHPVHTADDARSASAAQIARTRPKRLGWPARFVTGPVEDQLARLALHRGMSAQTLDIAAAVLALMAIAGFAGGWLWPGFMLALLFGLLHRVGAALAATYDAVTSRTLWDGIADLLFEASVCVALAAHFVSSEGWIAPVALAALNLLASAAASVATAAYRLMTGRHLDDAGPFERRFAMVSAAPDTRFWSLLPFAAVGAWYAGFIWLALYAAITCVIVQARFFWRLVAFARANSPLMAANIASARTQFLSGRGGSAN